MAKVDDSAKPISERHIQTVSQMVLAVVAVIYLVYWLRPVLVPFVVACFIVSGVGPILTHLENRFGVSRIVAAAMTFLFGVALMGVFGLTIWVSIIDLSANAPDYRSRMRKLVASVEKRFPMEWISSPAPFEPRSSEEPTDRVTDRVTDENRPDGNATAETAPQDDARGDDNKDTSGGGETVTEPAESLSDDSAEPQADATDDAPTKYLPGENLIDELPQSNVLLATPHDDRIVVPVGSSRGWDLDGRRSQEASELIDLFVRDGIAVVSQAFVNLVSTSVVVLIYVFFLLLGKPSYTQTGTGREIDAQIRSYLSLKTVISIGTGLVFGLTLRLFGVPMAMSFGVLAFLLNFIPNIGPIVASLLPIPLILLDPSGNFVWMACVIAATCTIQLLSGNVVEPKLMGNSSDLHPVTILLALMFWGMMWGIIGMFLATPITAAIKIVLERFEPTRRLAEIMAGRWEVGDSAEETRDHVAAANG